MLTSADQPGTSQVSSLEIYIAEIGSMEVCVAKIEAIKRNPSITIELSGLSKHLDEVDKGEPGATIMRFTPAIPSYFALKNPCDVFVVGQ